MYCYDYTTIIHDRSEGEVGRQLEGAVPSSRKRWLRSEVVPGESRKSKVCSPCGVKEPCRAISMEQ
jgi:hypothetical protein